MQGHCLHTGADCALQRNGMNRYAKPVKTASVSLMLLAGALAARGGVALTTLVMFGGTNGYYPAAGLIQATDGSLYGNLESQHVFTNLPYLYQLGFRLTTNGSLTQFNMGSGDHTLSRWVQRKYDGSLYCTGDEGIDGYAGGAVWEINTNGTTAFPLDFPAILDGTNGAAPSQSAGLIEGTDGNFYGTTTAGGISGNGTIWLDPADVKRTAIQAPAQLV
jgi:hypothetical protein